MKHFISIVTICFIACKKESDSSLDIGNSKKVNESLVTSESGNSITKSKKRSYKWSKNDEKYQKELIENAKTLSGSISSYLVIDPDPDPDPNPTPPPTYSCEAIGGLTYGFYEDPENLIVSGPYESASSSGQESYFQSCSSVDQAINSAKGYLLSEGYFDIVEQIELSNERYKLVHAANTLLDLKKQVDGTSAGTYHTARLANCILQAIGYGAASELFANWATASRQVILKAVGKLASRYIGWFGTAIALVSFADCMWG